MLRRRTLAVVVTVLSVILSGCEPVTEPDDSPPDNPGNPNEPGNPPPGALPDFTSPSTVFLEDDGTLANHGAWATRGFTLGSTTTLVFRVAAPYSMDAAIMPASEVEDFRNGNSYQAYASFSGTFGTDYVTLGAGSYVVGLRNRTDTANRWRYELDLDIDLQPQHGYTFTYIDNYVSGAELVDGNGGKLWQPFTIQNGIRYFLDGVSVGLDTFIIPASELSAFRNNQSFEYYTAYGGNSATANPGLWELKLPTGDYYLVFRNTGSIDGPVTYNMERWQIID